MSCNAKMCEKCIQSHHNNTALKLKKIPFDTALVMATPKFQFKIRNYNKKKQWVRQNKDMEQNAPPPIELYFYSNMIRVN